MRSRPVEVVQAVIEAVQAIAYPDDNPQRDNFPVFHFPGRRFDFRMSEGDRINVHMLFFRKSRAEVAKWIEILDDYFADKKNRKSIELLETGLPEESSFETLKNESGEIPSDGELCLEFLSPLPFKTEKGKSRFYISKKNFVRSFEKRFTTLFGRTFKYVSKNDEFDILPYYWRYSEIKHHSKSQPGTKQYINGCVGKFYLRGNFHDLLPFIILGSEVHSGTKRSNSQGYFRVFADSAPFFDNRFPDKKALLSVIMDVLEQYDDALETLSRDEMYPFEEETFAETLCNNIRENNYIPSPNTAFTIKRKNRNDRLVEQLSFKDLIVSRYLLKTVSKTFDSFFEAESIGFRKGIPREKAIQMVKSAVDEGFEYVYESDIEAFFPSIDLQRLKKLLDFYLPAKDKLVRSLLEKFLYTGYILKGNYHERLKGLAQGCPLSPILANLYLDSFDEKIKELNVRLIRYGDDFIILCKSKEDAETALSKSETFLSALGLKIKKEKTFIRPVKDGFQFLGMTFTAGGGIRQPEEEVDIFKKPLYITEPYSYLSLSGESIDIKKNKKILQTIPIRRVSEIMVMEKSIFSTALIKKCTEKNIPLTITLNNGYYITTIKPDSKKYFSFSYEHGRKYYSLSDTEILSIAKEFAAGKIKNYISLFKQKYKKGSSELLNELYKTETRIHQAGTIHEVRGIEGWSTRNIYRGFNSLIKSPFFQFEKRIRRNPDRVNSLMNFGYYLLFSRINATIRAVGLNPYLGFLHSPADDYESFVCDIQELFRARIDRLMIRLINLKVITDLDFVKNDRGYYLKRDGVKKYLSHFEAEMSKEPSKLDLSLKEHIYAQVDTVKNWILKHRSLTFYHWRID